MNQFTHDSQDHKYLIIGGTPKSATTSLFNYLADHPEVCPANRKETYFFAREFDSKNVCTIDETFEAFQTYFTHCKESHHWKMEATPYTLYSKNSAARIAAMLQNPTLLFVLRDPVERLLSEFHMQQQRQLESIRNMTPEQVVNRYLRNDAKDPDSFNNLKLGRYIEYLRHFWEMFGHDHVYVMFFEEITSNPQREMQALCSHLGLDATFYGDYSFNVFNKSVNPQSLVMNRFFLRMEPVIARTRSRVMNHTYIYGLFENLVRMGKFALHRLNDRGASTKQTFSPETRAQLIEYYKPSVSALSLELGRRLPWRNFQSDNVTTKPDET